MTFFACGVASLALMVMQASETPRPDHPIVAGFERFPADPLRGGLLLLGELNCTSCHRLDDALTSHFVPKQAPILDAVGSRAKFAWLRSFLADPQATKPGTTMPNLLQGLPEGERNDAVEALLQILSTTGKTSDRPIERIRIGGGSTLYHEIGCAVCHGPRDGSPVPPGSIPLPDFSAKYTLDSLRTFLVKPHEVRPSGRMPSLNLDDNQAWEIANFLRKDDTASSTPSLRFQVYEGTWHKLPDFAELKPVKSGTAAGFDLSQAPKANGFAMRFEGFVRVERDDKYSFHITSDDGSKLDIDGKEIADNDGIHPSQTKTGSVRLAAGFHKIALEYFDGAGQTELVVEIEGGKLPRQSVDAYLSLTDTPPRDEANPVAVGFAFNEGRAEKGWALFTSLGCASCHQLTADRKRPEPISLAASLSSLNLDSGCLAASPSKKSPRYSLSVTQRTALKTAIRHLASKPNPPADPERISRSLLAFNCYACHSRDGVGGVEDSRKDSFKTSYQDLGDEGKYPPTLNGVGAKLKKTWLARVLDEGAKDRPYMKTRMPNFRGNNVGDLAARFAAVDPMPSIAAVTLDTPEKKLKTIGRHLVGTQAFGCVQCHNFRGEASAGIPAIDMTLMNERLNHDWFISYLKNPQEFRPGTRMPAAWPNEESQLGDILSGNSRKQMEAVWTYLSDGSNANPPYGIGRSPIPLVADKEAILYRGFISGAGPRGIGVGFPEKVNLAFDANEGRIALIWRGAFIDASRHWTGRGEGFQPPLGDDIVTMPSGPNFASLGNEKTAWPKPDRATSDYKFKGYRLTTDGRPTFLYRLGSIVVEDSLTGVVVEKESQLRRVVTLDANAAPPNLYYRVAAGKTITKKAGDWYEVDELFSTKIEGAKDMILREDGDQAELLIRVPFAEKKTKLIQSYRW